MRLSAATQKHIEDFYREFLLDADLKLPTIFVYCGRFATFMTGISRVGAITFGRRILVTRNRIRTGENNRVLMPGKLLAHETMHVIQYKRAGVAIFLISYLGNFWRKLLRGRKWDRAARMNAYLAIEEEVEARAAEEAYEIWRAAGEMKASGY